MKMTAKHGDLAIRGLTVLLLLGLSRNMLVFAQSCTKATCPPGPVIAYFEYSNCTGEVTYSNKTVVAGCKSGSTTSIETFLTAEYFEERSWSNHPECGSDGSPGAYTSQRQYFGVCSDVSKRGLRSVEEVFGDFGDLSELDSDAMVAAATMYLPNVNASYEYPQEPIPVDNTYPPYDTTLLPTQCYGPDNCTWDAPAPFLWYTSYTNSTCAKTAGSTMYANISEGACYSSGNRHTRMRCLDRRTYIRDTMTGNGCERTLRSFIFHLECSTRSPHMTMHCNDEPPYSPFSPSTPVAEPTSSNPTSKAASTLTTTSIIIFIVASFMNILIVGQ